MFADSPPMDRVDMAAVEFCASLVLESSFIDDHLEVVQSGLSGSGSRNRGHGVARLTPDLLHPRRCPKVLEPPTPVQQRLAMAPVRFESPWLMSVPTDSPEDSGNLLSNRGES